MSKAKEPYCDLDCFHCREKDCNCPDAECVAGVYEQGNAPDDWDDPADKPERVKRMSSEEYYARKRKMIREIIEKEKALHEAQKGREKKDK